MPYSTLNLTLGQLLESEDQTIKRNAMSIFKLCQRCDHAYENDQCIYCYAPDTVARMLKEKNNTPNI